LNNAVINTGSG